MRAIFFFFFKIFAIVALPFICLIRGAIFLTEQHQLLPIMAIIGGIVGAAFVLAIYLLFFYGRLTGEVGSVRRKLYLALFVVALYGAHGLFFLSGNNVKHSSIQKEYTSLHPILRLSVSTIIHFDKSLIITDANRQPEDYRKMGLKSKKHSLHYRQSSGYVHALDIRTKNRGMVRNFLLQTYFKLMGFNTLRHGGTGDHLHVSIKSQDRPNAI